MFSQLIKHLYCFVEGCRLMSGQSFKVFLNPVGKADFIHHCNDLSQVFMSSKLLKVLHFP